MATAGRTVLFSSLTVAGALASLLVFPQRFLYSMGIGGSLVALIAAAIALIVLPAVLALLGDRVNSLAPAFLHAPRRARRRDPPRGLLVPALALVMRVPGRIAIATATLLIVLGLPFFGDQLHLGRRPGAARVDQRAPGRRRAARRVPALPRHARHVALERRAAPEAAARRRRRSPASTGSTRSARRASWAARRYAIEVGLGHRAARRAEPGPRRAICAQLDGERAR